MLEFWIDLARLPPVKANASFFRSLGEALQRLLLREPVRSFSRRVRDLRIFVSLLRKHRLSRLSGLEAALLEFVMTARFDNVSDVLERIQTAYLFDTSPLRERLVRHRRTRPRDLRHTGARLAINTIDVRTGGTAPWRPLWPWACASPLRRGASALRPRRA